MSWQLSAFADEAGPSIEEQISALQEANLKYIDLRKIDDYSITDLPIEIAQEVANKLKAAGITVSMFGSPIGKRDLADGIETDLALIEHLGKMKPIFSCKRVRMFSYKNKTMQLTDEAYAQKVLANLESLILKADELGLELYLENEGGLFGQYCKNVLLIHEKLCSKYPQFKLIYDFANFQHSGEDAWENWVALRDIADAIHLKEVVKIEGVEHLEHVPVGTGDGHVPKILADAAARGFDGPLTIEPHLRFSNTPLSAITPGETDESYSDMPLKKSFLIAAEAAKMQLSQVNRL